MTQSDIKGNIIRSLNLMSTTNPTAQKPAIEEIEAPRDFFSDEELMSFLLHEKGKLLATNEDIPSNDLLRLTTPNWAEEKPQGLLVLFVRKTDTREADVDSPIERRIVPIEDKSPNPVLSCFIAGMCGPFSFETNKKIPQGMKMVLVGTV